MGRNALAQYAVFVWLVCEDICNILCWCWWSLRFMCPFLASIPEYRISTLQHTQNASYKNEIRWIYGKKLNSLSIICSYLWIRWNLDESNAKINVVDAYVIHYIFLSVKEGRRWGRRVDFVEVEVILFSLCARVFSCLKFAISFVCHHGCWFLLSLSIYCLHSFFGRLNSVRESFFAIVIRQRYNHIWRWCYCSGSGLHLQQVRQSTYVPTATKKKKCYYWTRGTMANSE